MQKSGKGLANLTFKLFLGALPIVPMAANSETDTTRDKSYENYIPTLPQVTQSDISQIKEELNYLTSEIIVESLEYIRDIKEAKKSGREIDISKPERDSDYNHAPIDSVEGIKFNVIDHTGLEAFNSLDSSIKKQLFELEEEAKESMLRIYLNDYFLDQDLNQIYSNYISKVKERNNILNKTNVEAKWGVTGIYGLYLEDIFVFFYYYNK